MSVYKLLFFLTAIPMKQSEILRKLRMTIKNNTCHPDPAKGLHEDSELHSAAQGRNQKKFNTGFAEIAEKKKRNISKSCGDHPSCHLDLLRTCKKPCSSCLSFQDYELCFPCGYCTNYPFPLCPLCCRRSAANLHRRIHEMALGKAVLVSYYSSCFHSFCRNNIVLRHSLPSYDFGRKPSRSRRYRFS